MGVFKKKKVTKKVTKPTKKKVIKKKSRATNSEKVVKKTTKKKVVKKKNPDVGYKKPPKEHQWKPGQSGNPGGVTKERARLKTVSERSIADAITTVLTSTTDEINEMLDDPSTPVGEIIILRACLNAAEGGEYTRFDEILQRVIGKVGNKIDLTSAGKSLQEKLVDKEIVRKALKEIEDDI